MDDVITIQLCYSIYLYRRGTELFMFRVVNGMKITLQIESEIGIWSIVYFIITISLRGTNHFENNIDC